MNDRYSRHALIDWFPQDRIQSAKIGVIGAGAIGNEVTKNLALLGVGEIHVYDFDTIEEHNLTRSILFRARDIGQSKAVVVADRAQDIDPNITAYPHVGDFWDCLSFAELETFDALICGADNFEARIRANTLAMMAGTDLVSIAIDSRFASVEVFPFSDPAWTACFECALPLSVYARMRQRYSCGHLRRIGLAERRVPTTIITAAAGAAQGVSWALRMQELPGKGAIKHLHDTITGASTTAEISALPECPGCGSVTRGCTIIPSPRKITPTLGDHLPQATVTFSEPVLIHYRVPGREPVKVFRRASDFDSDFASTVSNDPDAVEIEIKDQFTLHELTTDYVGVDIPVKFAILSEGREQIVLEFEGGHDV